MVKLIFDIDDNRFEKIKCAYESYFDCPISLKLCDATILSTNTTNGDVIKSLFNVEIVDDFTFSYGVKLNDYYVQFNKDWWNTPYEGEVNEN